MFIENEFFDYYVNLIEKNIDNPVEKYKTQKHHIIPRSYYKMLNQLNDDSKENIVNLLYKDHILAHYYISKCSKESIFKYKNICAVNRIIRGLHKYGFYTIEDLIDNIDIVQDFYEEAKHINCLKSDTPSKISKSLVGRISIEKDGSFKYVKPIELDDYINNGWIVGHNKQTNESKKAISEKNLDRVLINKNGVLKRVKTSVAQDYINIGWSYGFGYKKDSPIKGKVAMHLDNKIIYVFKDDIDKYTTLGYILGGIKCPVRRKVKNRAWLSYTSEMRSKALKGRKAIHNGNVVKYVNPDDLDKFLLDGWLLGTGKFKNKDN